MCAVYVVLLRIACNLYIGKIKYISYRADIGTAKIAMEKFTDTEIIYDARAEKRKVCVYGKLVCLLLCFCGAACVCVCVCVWHVWNCICSAVQRRTYDIDHGKCQAKIITINKQHE